MTILYSVSATPNTPYEWPMMSYPGFVGKTGDYYTMVALASPEILAVTLPSVWSSSTVDFDITVQPGVDITITNVTCTGPTSELLTITKIGATTFHVSGTISSMTGEYYEFLMRDKTYALLPPVNTEDWVALIKWNPPGQPWERSFTYTFDITYDSLGDPPITGQTDSVTVTQYSYWSWEQSLASLQTLASQGEL